MSLTRVVREALRLSTALYQRSDPQVRPGVRLIGRFTTRRAQRDEPAVAAVTMVGDQPLIVLRGGIGRELISDGEVWRRGNVMDLFGIARGVYDRSLLDAAQTDVQPFRGMVHPGMAWRASQLNWSEIEHALETRDRGVIVAGHSLGAGLATLAAPILIARGISVRAVLSFGAPRVGDQEFVRCFPTQALRFETAKDPVPLIGSPATDLRRLVPKRFNRRLFGAHQVDGWVRFRHVGPLIYEDPAGEWHSDSAVLCRARTLRFARDCLTRRRRMGAARSHLVRSYVQMAYRARRDQVIERTIGDLLAA